MTQANEVISSPYPMVHCCNIPAGRCSSGHHYQRPHDVALAFAPVDCGRIAATTAPTITKMRRDAIQPQDAGRLHYRIELFPNKNYGCRATH